MSIEDDFAHLNQYVRHCVDQYPLSPTSDLRARTNPYFDYEKSLIMDKPINHTVTDSNQSWLLHRGPWFVFTAQDGKLYDIDLFRLMIRRSNDDMSKAGSIAILLNQLADLSSAAPPPVPLRSELIFPYPYSIRPENEPEIIEMVGIHFAYSPI